MYSRLPTECTRYAAVIFQCPLHIYCHATEHYIQPALFVHCVHFMSDILGVNPGGDGGQVLPIVGVEGTLISMSLKVSACYVHLCIWYCDIML